MVLIQALIMDIADLIENTHFEGDGVYLHLHIHQRGYVCFNI